MSWSYPALAASTLMLAVLAYITAQNRGAVERPAPGVFLVYRATEVASYGLLSISAGHSPLIRVEVLLPWIAATQVLLLGLSLTINVYLLRRLRRVYKEE